MTRKTVAVAAAGAGTVFAILAGPRGPLGGLWRPMPMPEPTRGQISALFASGLIEAIGFGAAIAVLLVGRPAFARLARTPARANCAWLATAWLLGSWWPHTALHLHIGIKPSALAPIELVFHAGSIIMIALLLWALLPRITEPATPPRSAASGPVDG
jgi:hypothetical protein